MWCISENSAQKKKPYLFCDSIAAVGPLKYALKAFLTSIAPFEDRLNDLPPIFVLALRDRQICEVSWRREGSCVVSSRSILMLCSKQIHLNVLSAYNAVYVRGYTVTDKTRMLSPRLYGSNKVRLFRADSLARYLLQGACDSRVVAMDKMYLIEVWTRMSD